MYLLAVADRVDVVKLQGKSLQKVCDVFSSASDVYLKGWGRANWEENKRHRNCNYVVCQLYDSLATDLKSPKMNVDEVEHHVVAVEAFDALLVVDAGAVVHAAFAFAVGANAI